MRKLHEIGADLEALDDLLINLGGEISDDEIGAAIEALFDQIGQERDEKIRRICGLIANKEASAKMCEAESKRLKRMAEVEQNGAERLKKRLKQFFEDHKITKLDLGIFKPRIQANGGSAPLIVPEGWRTSAAQAPEQFHKVTVDLDTDAIRAAIQEYNKAAAAVLADIEDPEERKAALDAWLAESDWALDLNRLLEGCAIGERGTHLRLR
ncbi:MAG TPA: siphovirus Gp157 family protein [Blastocatellia bacterium]|nr:siphovirus Gp157 family protein [Blastocatellia bacterium]